MGGGTIKALDKLRLAVDLDDYIKICTLLAGETVYFPLGGTGKDKADRNRAICDAYKNGATVPALVEMFELSERQIWRIIGKGAV